MSEIIDLNLDRVMSLDEFSSYVEEHIDLDSADSMIEHAWALRALANDREFVLDAYHRKLEAICSGQTGDYDYYQQQSLALKTSEKFFVRANIWLPIETGKRTEKFEKRLFAFDLPHDHNFNFLTVGYFGPGYETDIYTYDHEQCIGIMDEPVDCDFQGRFRLTPGRVISFKSGTDVHIQYVPDEISLSLNLICRGAGQFWQQQYIFDVMRKRLIGGAGDAVSNRLFLVECSRHLGNDETVGILADLAVRFPCNKTKAVALQSLMTLDPAEAERAQRHVATEVRKLSESRIISGNYARSTIGG